MAAWYLVVYQGTLIHDMFRAGGWRRGRMQCSSSGGGGSGRGSGLLSGAGGEHGT